MGLKYEKIFKRKRSDKFLQIKKGIKCLEYIQKRIL